MDLINIALTIAAIFNFGLGFYIYFQRKKNPVNIAFSLLTFSIFLWTISMIVYRWTSNPLATIWWCRILYFFPVFIAPSLLFFSIAFQKKEFKLTPKQHFFLWVPPLIIAGSALIPGFIIDHIVLNKTGEKAIYFGTGYVFYFIFYFIYFGWTFFNFLKRLKKSNFLQKKQLRWVIFATFTPVSLGLITNLILPWGFIFKFNWVAQAGTIFFVAAVAYAIVKYQLLKIKLIVAQVLSLFLISILFLNIFYFNNFWRFLLNLSVFILGLIFSGTLIRSVINEIEQKERISNLAEELKKANKHLKKLDQIKSEFISIASHQLRTPLSAIKGYAAMLLDEIQDSEEKEALNKIYLANERLIKLVNDLLNLSRIERGKLEFNFKKAQLSDLINSVVGEFQVIAQRRGLKLKYHKVDLPLMNLDVNKLRQALTNVIDNAIKYTPRGKIIVRTKIDDENATISVEDTGIGMRQEDLGAIYKKFQRGSSSAEIHPDGTGIGLYVAHKIIQAHGGKIWAESEGLNKGSTFYIKLPLHFFN
jgi:signal transduction histidine kinase